MNLLDLHTRDEVEGMLGQLCAVGVLKHLRDGYVVSKRFREVAVFHFQDIYDGSKGEDENRQKSLLLALISWCGRWSSSDRGVQELTLTVNVLETMINS